MCDCYTFEFDRLQLGFIIWSPGRAAFAQLLPVLTVGEVAVMLLRLELGMFEARGARGWR